MHKNIEVISLVYRSVDYLRFIVNQLKQDICLVDGWDVGFRIIANDATDEVLAELLEADIPHSVFNNNIPYEFYLNRVYSAYNYSVSSSNYDNVCLINSDMAFGEGWLANLLKHHDGTNIPCSLLIESGKMTSGQHGINLKSLHFGRSPNGFDNESWHKFVELMRKDATVDGGLYMPCIFEKSRFIEAGMFPRGNLSDVNGRMEVGHINDENFVMAGDTFFFKTLQTQFDMKHITVLDSMVYHIQEGEKDG